MRAVSKLLISCFSAINKHVIKYCEKVYERSSKIILVYQNSGEVLDKLKVVGDPCQKITLLLHKSKSVRVIVPESCF